MLRKEVTDFLLDEETDLGITSDGDFALGYSDAQHMSLIVQSNKGNWLQNPTAGAGIMRFLEGTASLQEVNRAVRLALEADGYSVQDVKIGEDIDIKATRVR